ncbi:hypothetical protein BY996DRAFT_6494235, partial [Phakopsora pachyrhizi]
MNLREETFTSFEVIAQDSSGLLEALAHSLSCENKDQFSIKLKYFEFRKILVRSSLLLFSTSKLFSRLSSAILKYRRFKRGQSRIEAFFEKGKFNMPVCTIYPSHIIKRQNIKTFGQGNMVSSIGAGDAAAEESFGISTGFRRGQAKKLIMLTVAAQKAIGRFCPRGNFQKRAQWRRHDGDGVIGGYGSGGGEEEFVMVDLVPAGAFHGPALYPD